MSPIDRGIHRGGIDRGEIIVFTGVNGAGKTTLLKRARQAGIIPQNVRGIELGNRLAKRLRVEGVTLSSKDGIRTLPPKIVNDHIRGLITETIQDARTPTIVVSHLVYEQNGELVSLLDHYSEYTDQIQGIFPIFGKPEDILYRREKGKRGRNIGTHDAITRHQEAILTDAIELASRANTEARLIMSSPLQDGPTLHHVADAMRVFGLAA
jgi:adenylate kinase